MTASLEIRHLTHRFGAQVALDDISLTVHPGEFLTILGPSGSGKTTLLRMVGGFEQPSEAATLSIAGEAVAGLPANLRPVTTVFQHFALFPHMSVGRNVEYGLKLRGIAQQERTRRAEEALAMVRLAGKSGRRITQLSGGERQRVALARALVVQPAILLLDEPMGALDEKLRRDMQIELRQLQKRLGMTFIQVTHSREEALTMSDRVVVMNRGRIEQIGAPTEIFEQPASRFVAEFMGLGNIISGSICDIGANHVGLKTQGGGVLQGRWTGANRPGVGAPGFFALHPSRLRLVGRDDPDWRFSATPARTVYKGADVEIEFDTPLGSLIADLPRAPGAHQSVNLGWSTEDAVVGPIDPAPLPTSHQAVSEPKE